MMNSLYDFLQEQVLDLDCYVCSKLNEHEQKLVVQREVFGNCCGSDYKIWDIGICYVLVEDKEVGSMEGNEAYALWHRPNDLTFEIYIQEYKDYYRMETYISFGELELDNIDYGTIELLKDSMGEVNITSLLDFSIIKVDVLRHVREYLKHIIEIN